MSTGAASSVSPTAGPPSPLARALLLVVEAYRVTLAPLIGGLCRYEPSCSRYAEEAVLRHGAGRGLALRPPSPPLPPLPGGRHRPRAVNLHPKGDMEERRLLLALALSILVMTAWGYLFAPNGPRPGRRPQQAGSPAAGASPRTDAAPDPGPTSEAPGQKLPPSPGPVSDERERRVEVSLRNARSWPSATGVRGCSPGSCKRHRDRRGSRRGDGSRGALGTSAPGRRDRRRGRGWPAAGGPLPGFGGGGSGCRWTERPSCSSPGRRGTSKPERHCGSRVAARSWR